MNSDQLKDKYFQQLIKHIPKSAYGSSSSMYSIALEGWRRGLEVKFYITKKHKVRYSLSNGTREHKFSLSLGDKVPRTTTSLTKNKSKTKELFIKHNVPTPKGLTFDETYSVKEMVQAAREIPYPLVVKPTSSSLGIGVTTGISSEEQVEEVIEYTRNELGHKNLIIEQCINGEDIRVVVVDGEVIAAYKREPISVIGDGKSTIEVLINKKNEIRKKHPHAYRYLIKINEKLLEKLESQNYSLSSVLEKDKKLYLSDSTLFSDGAETIDITDEISEETKQVAINALKAVPDMEFAGIDVMVDFKDGKPYVLEINSRPDLSGALFPMVGKPRNVPSALIDYYFPETKNLPFNEAVYNMKFDYTETVKLLKNGKASEVRIPILPINEFKIKKVLINGKDFSLSMRKVIRNLALKFKINGHIQLVRKDMMEMSVAGAEKNIIKLIDEIKSKKWKKAKITTIKVEDHIQPITLGFEIL